MNRRGSNNKGGQIKFYGYEFVVLAPKQVMEIRSLPD